MSTTIGAEAIDVLDLGQGERGCSCRDLSVPERVRGSRQPTVGRGHCAIVDGGLDAIDTSGARRGGPDSLGKVLHHLHLRLLEHEREGVQDGLRGVHANARQAVDGDGNVVLLPIECGVLHGVGRGHVKKVKAGVGTAGRELLVDQGDFDMEPTLHLLLVASVQPEEQRR